MMRPPVSLSRLRFTPGSLEVDAATGKPLWDFQAGGACRANPVSYLVEGRQHVAVAMGQALFVFPLP
jgi:hypothetical protein